MASILIFNNHYHITSSSFFSHCRYLDLQSLCNQEEMPRKRNVRTLDDVISLPVFRKADQNKLVSGFIIILAGTDRGKRGAVGSGMRVTEVGWVTVRR